MKCIEHSIILETFVKTAQKTQQIVEALNQSFFQSSLKYEIVVLTPEPGTFLSKLGVYVVGGVAGVFAFANSDIGKGYVEGLTGHDPAYWATQLGEEHNKKIENGKEWLGNQTDMAKPFSDQDCSFGSKITVEMTRGILEKSKSELEKIGMRTGSLPDAIEARNEFYDACIADPDIKGIGFSPEDDFPIPRNLFPERAIRARRPDELEEEIDWNVAVESIFVTSPNWDKDDQISRKWKGKDSVMRDCYFVIEDEEFWMHAKERDLNVNVRDKLKVQWAYQDDAGRTKNRRVLKVLEFNDEQLAPKLSEDAVKTILGSYSDAEVNDLQQFLF